MSKAPGDSISSHGPEQSVKGRCLLRKEVPGRVVGSRRLGNLVVRAWLDGVDEVRELDGILNEEYWDVVPNNVKVSFVSVTTTVSVLVKTNPRFLYEL